jgi:hypothetical protein
MTLTYWPTSGTTAQGGNSSEDRWELMEPTWLGSGVIQGVGNELAVYGNSTGMLVRVPSGRAWLDGTMANEDASGGDISLTIAAANATNPRIDRIVLRRDFIAHTMVYVVLAGTPAVVPVPPSISRVAAGVFDLSLAQVRVNAGAVTISAANVTDERSDPSVCGWATQGNTALLCTSTTHPATFPRGGHILELDTGAELWNSGTYASPAWTRTGLFVHAHSHASLTGVTVDTSAADIHHTLGAASFQASAGDHGHVVTFGTEAGFPGITGSGALMASNDPHVVGQSIATSGTVTLPAATGNAGMWRHYKAWGGSLTIQGPGGLVLIPPGATAGFPLVASFVLQHGESASLYCDGVDWWTYDSQRATRTQSGQLGGQTVAANSFTDVTVTFPIPFASTPSVVATPAGDTPCRALLQTWTATSAVIRIRNDSGSTQLPGLHWMAQGPM